MSLHVLRTPVRAPQANAYCERFIGTARRECLDWVIPLNEWHLLRVLTEWMPHYNGERPPSALGPGLPADPTRQTTLTGHRLRQGQRVIARARFGVCTTITARNKSRPEFLRRTTVSQRAFSARPRRSCSSITARCIWPSSGSSGPALLARIGVLGEQTAGALLPTDARRSQAAGHRNTQMGSDGSRHLSSAESTEGDMKVPR
jgi:hypothetical protein